MRLKRKDPEKAVVGLPSISDAEREVMKVFWDRAQPLAARDVYGGLPAGHRWAYRTVKTLLSRLVAKGALAFEEVGNAYLYRPLCSRDQITREEVRGFVERVLGGSLVPVLAHFIESGDLSDEEIDRARRLLEEKKGRATSKSSKRGK